MHRLSLVLFLGFLGSLAKATADSNFNLHFDQSYETYFSAQASTYQNTVLNPGNQYFQFPSEVGEIDFRPDWKFSFLKFHKLVMRPRYLLNSSRTRYTNPTSETNTARGKFELTDFFLEDQWADSLKTVVGLQVYQWGPAELINPSNPLFHFNNRQRGAFYKEKGQVLLRANLDWNKHWGQVFIFEPISNNEPEWVSRTNFVQKGLLKTEYRFDNPVNYMGLVVGREELQKSFFGEYLTVSPYEGFSLYTDARHTEGLIPYRPQGNIYAGYSLERNDAITSWYTLAVSGLRYEAVNYDLRLEYVYNEHGLNKEKFAQYLLTIQQLTPDLPNNLVAFAKPGLELLGQQYLYLSLRFPNLGKKEDMSLAFRIIGSVQDSSAVLQSDFDKNINDHLTAYLEAFTPSGAKETELNLFGQSFYMVGLKWNL